MMSDTSYRVCSQLSLAIFTASRTYVVAQKSSKQFQTPLKLINPYEPGGGFTSLRDIMPSDKAMCSDSWVRTF